MAENSEDALNTVEVISTETPRQLIVPALASAVVPGIGQLALKEKRSALIYLALLVVWFVLFLPPFRIPHFYPGALFAIFSAIALMVTASWRALRSRAWNLRSGSYWWLFVLIPLACIVASLYWAVALRVGGFRGFTIPSTSMEPTIMSGDVILADMRYYQDRNPSEDNLILFRSPTTQGLILLKRVIGTGGDTIRSEGGQIYLNGKPLDEPYVEHIGGAPDEMMDFGPIAVPPRKLFVMGDNRDVSLDSRAAEFGLIDESAVMGRALYIFRSPHDRTGESLK